MRVFSTNDLEDLEKEVLRLAKKYPKKLKNSYKNKEIS